MRKESVNELVNRARKDPKFFHSLIFDPEKVIADLDFLNREEKGHLIGLDPSAVIDVLVEGSPLASCGETNTCGYTCNVTNTGRRNLAEEFRA